MMSLGVLLAELPQAVGRQFGPGKITLVLPQKAYLAVLSDTVRRTGYGREVESADPYDGFMEFHIGKMVLTIMAEEDVYRRKG